MKTEDSELDGTSGNDEDTKDSELDGTSGEKTDISAGRDQWYRRFVGGQHYFSVNQPLLCIQLHYPLWHGCSQLTHLVRLIVVQGTLGRWLARSSPLELACSLWQT